MPTKTYGSGKGGKTRPPITGKSKRLARQSAKSVYKNNLKKPSIRRLCRRAGIKRISNDVYGIVRDTADVFMKHVMKTAGLYTTHARRRTISHIDISYSLKRMVGGN